MQGHFFPATCFAKMGGALLGPIEAFTWPGVL